jgi:hypothetical protein
MLNSPNIWVQATLDYAFWRFLSRRPSAPDPARYIVSEP